MSTSTKIGVASCCCYSGDGHGDPCYGRTICVHVTGLGGSDISGLIVQIVFSDPSGTGEISYSGFPDADGKFCQAPPSTGTPPVYGVPKRVVVTTTLGASLSSLVMFNGTNCDVTFDYCETKLVATAVDGDTGGAIAATIGGVPFFGLGGQVCDGCVVEASGVGVVAGSTSVTYTQQTISHGGASSTAGLIPEYVAAYAGGYYGHYNCCFPLGQCAPCGQTYNLSICLWPTAKYVWSPLCDFACLTSGPGNDHGCSREVVIPKKLCTVWDGPDPIFGGDAGSPVTLNWDPTSWDGRLDHAPYGTLGVDSVIVWESDCSPSGSYGGCYTTSINNCFLDEGTVYHDNVLLDTVPYSSRQVVLHYKPIHGVFSPATSLSFNNYWTGDCTITKAPVCHGSVEAGDAIYASPMGYCNWGSGNFGGSCPMYATHPPPSGPQLFYYQSVGVSVPDSVFACQTSTSFSGSGPVGPGTAFGVPCSFVQPGSGGTFTVSLSEDCTYPGTGGSVGMMSVGQAHKTAFAARRPYSPGKIRVGFLGPVLVVGGAESVQVAIAHHLDDRFHVQGVVAIDPHINEDMNRCYEDVCPVGQGVQAARDLASQCDVIVTWAVEDLGAILEGLERRPRVVSVCHSPAQCDHARTLYARVADETDAWVAVSEYAREAIPEDHRASAHIIGNCVDTHRLVQTRSIEEMRRSWGVPEGALVCGYFGRISPEKRPGVMIEIARALPAPWHVVVVGPDWMKGLVEQAGDIPNLHWVGPDTRAGDVLRAMDVLCVPSDFESWCLSMAEAIEVGTPVVSTPVGLAGLRPGLSRIVPHGAGGDVWAYQIQAAVYDGRPRGQMAAIREAMQTWRPESFGQQWSDVLAEVAS